MSASKNSRRRGTILAVVICGGCFSAPQLDERTESTGATGETGGTGGEGTTPNSATTTDGVDTTEDPSADEAGTTLPPQDIGCSMEGCPCASDDDCDPGACGPADVCVASVCGDDRQDEGEQCDDGNEVDGDGCDNDCTVTEVEVHVGQGSTCVLIEGGRVRCWGRNDDGQLGYGTTLQVGDDEHPYEMGDVPLPAALASLQSGAAHRCGTRESPPAGLVCWGAGALGRLGYGNTDNLGDDETLRSLANVDVGVTAELLTLGSLHTCVASDGQARCWGSSSAGATGQGMPGPIGDDETPGSVDPDVALAEPIVAIASHFQHTCTIGVSGGIRCWGNNQFGQLGRGNTETVGDDETPQILAALPFSDPAIAVTVGFASSCALFETGEVRCWGGNGSGDLGQGHTDNIGDDEMLDDVTPPPIDFGGALAVEIASGSNHTCALMDDGALRCWGINSQGRLGLGSTESVGDDESPGAVDPVALDGVVVDFDAGGHNTCVVLDTGAVRCWGNNQYGALGLATEDNVGDDELPLDVPPIALFAPR